MAQLEFDRMRIGDTMSSTQSDDSFICPPDSPGSSVSSRLQEEYDELLKYAVVVPTQHGPETMARTLTDMRDSFRPPPREPFPATMPPQDPTYVDESATQYDWGESPSRFVATPSERQDTQRRNVFGEPVPQDTDSEETASTMTDRQPQFESTQMSSRQGDSSQEEPRTAASAPRATDPPLIEFSESGPSTQPTHSTLDDDDMTFLQYSVTIDQDVTKMENVLDQWSAELKRKVLAEFSQSKIHLIESSKRRMKKDQEVQTAEKQTLLNQMEGMKELLHTYERSIERKDQIIANLTRGMQKQRQRFDMLHTFCDWKLRYNELKKESFAMNLAGKHHSRVLARRYWDGWRSMIQTKWQDRVSKACQAKAEEVCQSLTDDYDTQIKSLNEALDSARTEVTRLHTERDCYEQTMKKAFMRGVCALNLEAMSMFQHGEAEETCSVASTDGAQTGFTGTAAHYQENMAGDGNFAYAYPTPMAAEVLVEDTRGGNTIDNLSRYGAMKMKPPAGRGKTLTAKLSCKTDAGQSGGHMAGRQSTLAPPMSSIIVERHQPIVKKTIGQATAGMYQVNGNRSNSNNVVNGAVRSAGIIHRKLAGQSGTMPIATPKIQTVKLVE